MPALYEEVQNDIDSDLMHLYENGYVDIEYDENLNVKFKPTELTKDLMENYNPEDFGIEE